MLVTRAVYHDTLYTTVHPIPSIDVGTDISRARVILRQPVMTLITPAIVQYLAIRVFLSSLSSDFGAGSEQEGMRWSTWRFKYFESGLFEAGSLPPVLGPGSEMVP